MPASAVSALTGRDVAGVSGRSTLLSEAMPPASSTAKNVQLLEVDLRRSRHDAGATRALRRCAARFV
jgi:pyocin large subunit-like protein